jgi:hypothetical protein
MTEREYNALIHKQRRLPGEIEAALTKLHRLLAKAEEIGRKDLLTNPALIDLQWDIEVRLAKLGASHAA